jgi:glutamyl-tRNA synthetase
MSQFSLTLATKANQAALLPVLLVATSVNEARPSPIIAIKYEDAATLQQGDKAIVEFIGASGSPAYGAQNALQELRTTFPFLNSKEEKLVSTSPSQQ